VHDHHVAQRLVHRERDEEPEDGGVGARRERSGSIANAPTLAASQ
jgi:hypothetical protein